MSAQQLSRILCFSREPEEARALSERLHDQYDVVCPDSIEDGLEILQTGGFSGLFLCGSEMTSAGLLLQAGGILQQLHDGVPRLRRGDPIGGNVRLEDHAEQLLDRAGREGRIARQHLEHERTEGPPVDLHAVTSLAAELRQALSSNARAGLSQPPGGVRGHKKARVCSARTLIDSGAR